MADRLLLPLPAQPAGVPWPTDAWPTGTPPLSLASVIDRGFEATDELGLTLSVVVIHGGRLVVERYGETSGPDVPLISWSMAKSITHALCGIAVRDGLLDTSAPTGLSYWSADDPRAPITVDQLLTMTSGLRWVEDYVDGDTSTVIEMLFGAGAADHARYSAGFDLEFPPGTAWRYSSGTSNLLAAVVTNAFGGTETALRHALHNELTGPLGMTTSDPRFDDAGTFVGSSYFYASARDFARFGYLYLRDGWWEDRRILPEGWVDRARTFTALSASDEVHDYGQHWWLWRGELGELGAFGAHGYEGQYTLVVPALDLVVVRLGKSPEVHHDALREWMRSVVRCFR